MHGKVLPWLRNWTPHRRAGLAHTGGPGARWVRPIRHGPASGGHCSRPGTIDPPQLCFIACPSALLQLSFLPIHHASE
jgi:hypothetical protein